MRKQDPEEEASLLNAEASFAGRLVSGLMTLLIKQRDNIGIDPLMAGEAGVRADLSEWSRFVVIKLNEDGEVDYEGTRDNAVATFRQADRGHE